MEVLLNDLSPNSRYVVQVRAVGGEEVSEWSPSLEITTGGDTIAPSSPTSLSWTVQGTSFLATWSAPTTDSNGGPLKDFKDYVVTITGNAQSKQYVTAATRFDFTYEMNRAAFGMPQASLTISVAARDIYGNVSTGVVSTAVNAAPQAPSNVTTASMTGAVSVSWTPSSDSDIDRYALHMYTTSGEALTVSNQVFLGKVTSAVVNVPDTANRYFKVIAYDTFGSYTSSAEVIGSAAGAAGVDTTPPGPPTNLAATSTLDSGDPSGGTSSLKITWTQPADADVFGYKIRYRKQSTTDWSYVDAEKGTSAVIGGLRSNTTYDVQVATYDVYNNISSYVSVAPSPTTATDTTAPVAVTGLTVSTGVKSITLSWVESSEGDVVNGRGYYQIQRATDSAFTANSVMVNVSATVATMSNVVSGTTYYFRVRAVDASGNLGAYSGTVSIVAGSVTNAEISAGTISGDKIVSGTITSTQIQAGSVDADRLKANTAIVNDLNVRANLTIDAAGGSIKSSNYNQANKTGFKLTQNSLEIFDGVIDAKALKLQNGHNLIPTEYSSFEADASFYTLGKGLSASATLGVATTSFYTFLGMRILSLDNTMNATATTVNLSRSSSEYPIKSSSTGTYIGSLYVLQDSGSPLSGVGLNLADTGGISNSIMPTIPHLTWTRVWVSRMVTSGFNARIEIVIPAGKKVFIACAQYELQITSETSPSVWKPSGVTSIDGATITTGQIRSNNYAAGTQGWMIDTNGSAEFATGIFRGDLAGANISGSSFEGGSLAIPTTAEYDAGAKSQFLVNSDEVRYLNKRTKNMVFWPSFESESPAVSIPTVGASSAGVMINARSLGPRESILMGKNSRAVAYGQRCLKVWNNGGTGNGGTVVFPIAHWKSPETTRVNGKGLLPLTTYTMSFYVCAGTAADTPVVNDMAVRVKFSDIGVWDYVGGVLGGGTGGTGRWATGVDRFIGFKDVEVGINYEVKNSTALDYVTSYSGWSRRYAITFTTPNWPDPDGGVPVPGRNQRSCAITLPAPYSDVTGDGDNQPAVFYDGFQIEEGPDVTRYVDGDQPDCSWPSSSTEHNSSSYRVGNPTLWMPSYADPVINANLKTGDTQVSRIKIGNHEMHGANFMCAIKTAATSSTSGTWTDVVFENLDQVNIAQDDGAIRQAGGVEYASQSPGIYCLSAVITWAAHATGHRSARLVTEGGTTLAWDTMPVGLARTLTLTWTGYLPGNGYKIKVLAQQNSGVALDIAADAATLPTRLYWTQLL